MLCSSGTMTRTGHSLPPVPTIWEFSPWCSWSVLDLSMCKFRYPSPTTMSLCVGWILGLNAAFDGAVNSLTLRKPENGCSQHPFVMPPQRFSPGLGVVPGWWCDGLPSFLLVMACARLAPFKTRFSLGLWRVGCQCPNWWCSAPMAAKYTCIEEGAIRLLKATAKYTTVSLSAGSGFTPCC